jgi:hypothetical protein
MRNHTLNPELINKAITQMVKGGRKVDIIGCVAEGLELIEKDYRYESAGEAVALFKGVCWNHDLVK